MAEISNVMALGVLVGIAILALKTGLGCGFANLKRREIIYVAFIYLAASLILSYLVGVIPLDITQNILATGVTMHVIIAIGLVYFGIKTKKEWISQGKDVSRKTFLLLSIPCPACLTATFLACLMLSQLSGISHLWIGILVGVIFFIGVCGFSFAVSYVAALFTIKNPSSLGTAMILFGLFYLLSLLIIPAYIQAESIPVPQSTVNSHEVMLSLVVMSLLMGIGVLVDRARRRSVKEGEKWIFLQG